MFVVVHTRMSAGHQIVGQRYLFVELQISNCGSEMRHKNAEQNFGAEMRHRIAVQECGAELRYRIVSNCKG